MPEVFASIQNAGLELNPKECEFLYESVKYLGGILDQDGVRPESLPAATIRPSQSKQMRSYLEVAKY